MRKILLCAACALCLLADLAPAKQSTFPKMPKLTAAFVKYCAAHEAKCADYLSWQSVSLALANGYNKKPGYCGSDHWDGKAALKSVLGWIAFHPESATEETSETVDAALNDVYPCKASASFPERSADFVAFCRTNRGACLKDIFARSLRLVIMGDPNFCRPKDQSEEQIDADDEAIRQSLTNNAATPPDSSYQAIEDAWRTRYPCPRP